jgi:hypothetical protein
MQTAGDGALLRPAGIPARAEGDTAATVNVEEALGCERGDDNSGEDEDAEDTVAADADAIEADTR